MNKSEFMNLLEKYFFLCLVVNYFENALRGGRTLGLCRFFSPLRLNFPPFLRHKKGNKKRESDKHETSMISNLSWLAPLTAGLSIVTSPH